MPPLATFDRMQTWLAGRTNLPTVLSARDLAMLPEFEAGARAQAFFSAKVSEANILQGLRAEVESYIRGDVDRATARLRLKTFLSREGFPADDIGATDRPPAGVDVEDWQAHKQATNLASTRRLDLILDTQARMAHAVGREQISRQPAVEERWPNFVYIAVNDGRERPEHGALDGLTLPKSDPFWATHTPPWDYGCRCDKEDAEATETLGTVPGARVLNPATGQVVDTGLATESGFVFDLDSAMSASPDAYDWTAIQDAALRARYQEQFPDA